MNEEILKKHIKSFVARAKKEPKKFTEDFEERVNLINYYQLFSKEKILVMTPETMYEYLSQLWAMLIWGNKHYIVDKIIEDNGLEKLRTELSELVWGEDDITDRWDNFRSKIKGIGPAMISEILCKTHPEQFMLWNRRAYTGLHYLGVQPLPRHDYQLTGKVYKNLCRICGTIAAELEQAGFPEANLLTVDYFIWDELQVEDNLSKTQTFKPEEGESLETPEESKFIHNEIRDKIRDIGEWLGFRSRTEQKVSEGSQVDTIWEATIGNMGRVIYVFEVQTKGNIDGLIVNLLKSLNNPAVQGVVAVSDKKQLEKIQKHASDVKDLRDKLKYWDYEDILKVHESLEFVNSSINNLGLVPQGF